MSWTRTTLSAFSGQHIHLYVNNRRRVENRKQSFCFTIKLPPVAQRLGIEPKSFVLTAMKLSTALTQQIRKDSNFLKEVQSLLCCRYTTDLKNLENRNQCFLRKQFDINDETDYYAKVYYTIIHPGTGFFQSLHKF